MTRQLAAVGLALCLLAGTVLNAAKIWDKPFNMWTDGELKVVATSSPWAGKARMTCARRPPDEFGDPENPRFIPLEGVALVAWSSALPLRQATERGKFKAGTAVPPDVQARLAAVPDAYVITVVHTNSSDFVSRAALMDRVRVTFAAAAMYPETSLRRVGKPPLQPVHVDKLLVNDGRRAARLYVFTFPKADLTVEDVKVEFVTRICSNKAATSQCDVNIKKTFMLKDMVYNGALAL